MSNDSPRFLILLGASFAAHLAPLYHAADTVQHHLHAREGEVNVEVVLSASSIESSPSPPPSHPETAQPSEIPPEPTEEQKTPPAPPVEESPPEPELVEKKAVEASKQNSQPKPSRPPGPALDLTPALQNARRLVTDVAGAWRRVIEDANETDPRTDSVVAPPQPDTPPDNAVPASVVQETPSEIAKSVTDPTATDAVTIEDPMPDVPEIPPPTEENPSRESREAVPIKPMETVEKNEIPPNESKAASPASTASQAALPKPVGVKSEARLIGESIPVYPDEAKRRGIEGTVILRLHVTAEGNVDVALLEKSSGSELLDHSAMEFSRSIRFSPASVDHVPVATVIRLPIRYRLIP
ncbi:MAG: energy transducer TonB [Planctomycetota bacterium]